MDDNAIDSLNRINALVHKQNKKWWTDLHTGEYPIKRNIGEMLMLVTSELAEALEGDRKNLMDDKLPEYRMFDVEIVDAMIRLQDIAGAMIPNFGEIWFKKMLFNIARHDHSTEGRLAEGGKKY